MSSTTELAPIIATEENLDKTLETLHSPTQSIKSGQNLDNLTEANKSPNPSVKSGEGVENVEAKIRSSLKSGQDLENVEVKKSLSPSISSGQGADNFEAKQSPSPSTKSGQGADNVEAKKSPSPSVKSGQGVEHVEVRKSLESSVVENVPIQQEPEKPQTEEKKLDETDNADEATREERKSTEPEQPPKRSESRRVSFSEATKPSGTTIQGRAFQGGFRSNKDVIQPSITEDPSLARIVTRNSGGASNRSRAVVDSRPQPWLYAVCGLFLLTIIMRFFMTNFKFVCVVVYAALVSMLALRYYGRGPFAGRRRH